MSVLPFIRCCVLFCSLLLSMLAHAEPANEHWGFNLTNYLWLPGTEGSVSVGSNTRTVNANFVDIVDKSRRFPLGFNGHFEAHYDKFAFYLDGSYMNVKLKPRFDNISGGINSEVGVMDYGLMYRVLGVRAAEVHHYQDKQRPVVLDVYAGARTIWMGNSLTLSDHLGLLQRTPSMNVSFTSPIIGGRVAADLTAKWFVLLDGNIGGFGAQSVQLTSNLLGAVGYKTSLFDVPVSIEGGYKALYYKVDKNGPTSTNVTLHGPFLGLTGYF
jgi:hypothetical protein